MIRKITNDRRVIIEHLFNNYVMDANIVNTFDIDLFSLYSELKNNLLYLKSYNTFKKEIKDIYKFDSYYISGNTWTFKKWKYLNYYRNVFNNPNNQLYLNNSHMVSIQESYLLSLPST